MRSHFSAVVFVSLLAASTASIAGLVSGQGTWETTLKARDINGDGATDAFYDSTLNLTWLKDWSIGTTSPAGAFMSWRNAEVWVSELTYGGHTGWRLPALYKRTDRFDTAYSNNGTTDSGYARSGAGWGLASELGHLFYVTLGNRGYCAPDDANPTTCVEQVGYGLSNTAEFVGIQGGGYWTNGYEGQRMVEQGWAFITWAGLQGVPWNWPSAQLLAVAVHDGDIGALAVPEPMTLSLALAGLFAAYGSRRRKCLEERQSIRTK